MSYDISTGGSSQTPCDHLQVLERYTVDPIDLRTLHYLNSSYNMRAPVNGTSRVRVYVKGVLVNPSHPDYGYSVVPDPDRVQQNYTFHKIQFNKPVRLVYPLGLIQVTYPTRPAFCLKCAGSGSVIDWSVSPSGQFNRVERERKLGQQVIKYIMTSINPFNPALTCPVRGYVGKKSSMVATDTDIASSVSEVLSQYQLIQRAQSRVQTLSPPEMLRDVESVRTDQDPNDPTTIALAVSVLAYQQTEPISLNIALQTSS